MTEERKDGYYWVLLPGRSELTIAEWRSVTETWAMDGWDWFDEGVGVASGRIEPPYERSCCAHPMVFRRSDQCKLCGTRPV